MVMVEISDDLLDTINKVLGKNGYDKIDDINLWLEMVIREWTDYNFDFDITYDDIDEYEV
jgi:hypothetical protein